MSSERQPPDDRELEDFIAGRHPVGRAYRDVSHDETAPPELDAAILSAAREAVRTPVVRRPRWIQPVALAATLVLGLSVLMNVWRDPQTREKVVPAAESAPSAPQPVTEESTVETQRAPSSTAAAAAKPALSDQLKQQQNFNLSGMGDAAPARDAAPPPPPASGSAVERDQPKASRFEMHKSLPDRALAPSMAPPAASAPGPASAPAEAEPEAKRESEARERGDDAQRQRSVPEAMPAEPVQDSTDQLGASGAAPDPRSVGQWMAQIRAEIERGDESAARDLLRDFRREHPDVELPPDLAAFERADR